MKRDHALQLEELGRTNSALLSELENTRATLRSRDVDHDSTLNQMRADHKQELDKLKQQHTVELKKIEQQHAQTHSICQRNTIEQEAQYASTTRKLEMEISSLERKYENAQTNATNMKLACESANQTIKERERQIHDLESQLKLAKDTNSTAIARTEEETEKLAKALLYGENREKELIDARNEIVTLRTRLKVLTPSYYYL